MKKSNTANRLKEIMNERGLKQIDILNACLPFCKKYEVKMSKSDISQYVSGQVEPGQDKLFVLGNALNVSESWLMGFDVPRDRVFTSPAALNPHSEPIILSYYNQLNALGQETATEHVRLLTLDKKYTEKTVQEFPSVVRDPDADYLKPQAAHARTDIEVTEEMIQNDDDIMNDENF